MGDEYKILEEQEIVRRVKLVITGELAKKLEEMAKEYLNSNPLRPVKTVDVKLTTIKLLGTEKVDWGSGYSENPFSIEAIIEREKND